MIRRLYELLIYSDGLALMKQHVYIPMDNSAVFNTT